MIPSSGCVRSSQKSVLPFHECGAVHGGGGWFCTQSGRFQRKASQGGHAHSG